MEARGGSPLPRRASAPCLRVALRRRWRGGLAVAKAAAEEVAAVVRREEDKATAGAQAARKEQRSLPPVAQLALTHSVRVAGESAKKGVGFFQAITDIGKKGNLPQVIRIIPYSAVQLFSYEVYKKVFRRKDGELSVFGRLAAGVCGGMISTLVIYPLDVLRLRLAVQSGHSTMSQVALNMLRLREEGLASFYGGLGPSLIEFAPYITAGD
ncbi:uncharacterized protein C2845_PM13G08600 [Panicum miliaceum]|uniref:Uncharacterized protein n=1 Tax=Panicum miliaceum TaxID=4540 RepID=A0A3L6RFN4_PANMI|nr:uncharacterized protein C2845_PM13G08600 [Panicum miliaceum]